MDDLDFISKIKILNDSTRIKILKMLSEKELMCGCKILEELNITQGTLSHHMKLLVDNKFVNCKKDGKWCFYSINKNTLLNIADYLKNI